MKFDDDLGMYIYKYKGVVFAWEDEPEDDDYKDTAKAMAKSYLSHLDAIIEHILPDVQECFGELSAEEVKESLGEPTIDIENGTLSYFEHTLDDCHIIEIEFLDDQFEELGYVSIDG